MIECAGVRLPSIVPLNLILFEPDEIGRPLPTADPRARHVLEVLRRRPGDSFDAGLTNGTPGRATLVAQQDNTLEIAFTPGEPLAPRATLRVLVGLPRPQTARDILRDATTLGATELHFVISARTDTNYASSSLWSTGEWRRHVLAGAMQAFDPRLPRVTWGTPLGEVLDELPREDPLYACDNYEAPRPLARSLLPGDRPLAIALGPERGWDASDRNLLRAHHAELVHLGPRVLRLETAIVAALTLVTASRLSD